MCTTPIHNFVANDIIVHNCGKSLTLEELKRDLVDCNPKEKFKILSFEFEMLATDQVARNISGRCELSTSEIYSANHEYLSDKNFNAVKKAAEIFKTYPIYFIDEVLSTDNISQQIQEFVKKELLEDKSEGLIVTIDHTLLTRGKVGQSEKELIDHLMVTLVRLKKYFASNGYKVSFVILSQLNRDIESMDRIANSSFHYPTKNDIFAASSVYYCSDVVIILHKPALLEGLGTHYGPPKKKFPKGLPVFTGDGVPLIYWHIIKSRFGTNKILTMLDDFKNSKVLEYSLLTEQSAN
jgi:replicative DNA helicase